MSIPFSSCDKEEEFDTMIQNAEESTYICNSLSGLMETAFDIMSYNMNISNGNHNLLNDASRLFFTDNYFFDNNGVACEVSFGTNLHGTAGYDDRHKSGKMQIRMSDFYSEIQNKITIIFNSPDQLKFHEQVIEDVFKTYSLIGKIEMTRLDELTWFYETKNLQFTTEEKVFEAELAGYINLVDGRLEGMLDNDYGVTFSGNFNQEYSIYSSREKMAQKEFGEDCSQNFQTGEWVLETASGKRGKLNFDPYNDASCDPFAKLTWEGKESLIKLH